MFLHHLGGEFGFESGEFLGTLVQFSLGGLLLAQGHVFAGLKIVLVVGVEFIHLLLIALLLCFFIAVELLLKVDGILVFGQQAVAVNASHFEYSVFGNDRHRGFRVELAGRAHAGEVEDVKHNESDEQHDIACQDGSVHSLFVAGGIVAVVVCGSSGRGRSRWLGSRFGIGGTLLLGFFHLDCVDAVVVDGLVQVLINFH